MKIVGIDLAWGERNPDGVCCLEVKSDGVFLQRLALTHGDEQLLGWLDGELGGDDALLAVDAPLVCVNETGARPVDRQTHVHFGRYKCGCYPANLRLCPRPARVGNLLVEAGYSLEWEMDEGRETRMAMEVYPHPALVRWLGLNERIPYKKGRVARKREVFAELQKGLRELLGKCFPELRVDKVLESLLSEVWTKNVEDKTDAFICALIALWHYRDSGRLSQVLGDLETGFLVVPRLEEEG